MNVDCWPRLIRLATDNRCLAPGCFSEWILGIAVLAVHGAGLLDGVDHVVVHGLNLLHGGLGRLRSGLKLHHLQRNSKNSVQHVVAEFNKPFLKCACLNQSSNAIQ